LGADRGAVFVAVTVPVEASASLVIALVPVWQEIGLGM
jgi:hypothetical protein